MGCTQSKIENEETVTRCKDRKLFMKDAVSFRNAFAAAHSAYSMSLKNSGAALSDYAHGEVLNPTLNHSLSSPASMINSNSLPGPQVNLNYDHNNLPPPPPPLPNFTASPLQRAASMPAFMGHKNSESVVTSHPIIEEDEEEEDDEDDDDESGSSRGLKHRSGSARKGSESFEEEGSSSLNHRRSASSSKRVSESLEPARAPVDMTRREAPPPPPPPESHWEFFFPATENVPGPSLAEVDEDRMEREEIQRKMYEEHSKKAKEAIDSVDEPKKNMMAEAAAAAAEMDDSVAELSPQPPIKAVKKVKIAPTESKRVVNPLPNLWKIFALLDDCFLKSSESAHDVSKMLEANRLHYHSNFADNRGHIDHSARVMRVITWNRSFRGLPNVDDGLDDFDLEENETHATILDKMLAWEKKLYDEVKTGEQMKLDYQKKVASLNKRKKRGASTEGIEKAKAAVSHLHTRYIVDMQSMDSTVSEINRLRDEQLYPKLVALVDGMAAMWETMKTHHETQSKIVIMLKNLDISQAPNETSEHHHARTNELLEVVEGWHMYFQKLITHQKEYIKALNSWLKLNLIPIDNNLKEKVSSPQRPQNPPIQTLLHAWHDFLDKLPDELASTAISNFAAVVGTILQHQREEIKSKYKCEDMRKDLARKTRQFEDWYNKYMQKRTPPDEMDPDRALESDHIAERQVIVEMVRKRLEEEEEAYQKQCIQVREKSLSILKSQLPELFRALTVFSKASSDIYRKLQIYITVVIDNRHG